jgi:hypothetical protein
VLVAVVDTQPLDVSVRDIVIVSLGRYSTAR